MFVVHVRNFSVTFTDEGTAIAYARSYERRWGYGSVRLEEVQP